MIVRLFIAVAVVASSTAGIVSAQTVSASASQPISSIRQPVLDDDGFVYVSALQNTAGQATVEEKPSETPLGRAPAVPSREIAPTTPPPDHKPNAKAPSKAAPPKATPPKAAPPKATTPPRTAKPTPLAPSKARARDPRSSSAADNAPKSAPVKPTPDPAYGGCGATSGGCAKQTCKSSCCCDPCVPWTLPQPGVLRDRGIRIGGWLQQGVSVVANMPADNFNGVVAFNDRDGEYQMNQFWLFAEKQVDTGGYGWDIGGRIDFVYGTDARFTQAADGLEANWNQTEPFYQAAMPQFYVDVGYNDWTLRVGHFFTNIGYEVVPAPDNFFYSHAYTKLYGEPFTHTGALLSRPVGDNWSVAAGVHRGLNQFDDTDGRDALDFLGGVNWTSDDERLSLAFALSASEQGPGVDHTVYSMVGTWAVSENLTYVIQHDLGDTFDPTLARRAQWYGLNQYLLYDINDCWAAGVRFEWFRDDQGVRVQGLGAGNQAVGLAPNPPIFPGNFYEVTAGLNWKPTANITVRPEVRWDWYEAGAPVALGNAPYDAGDRVNQFLLGCDVILTY